MGELTTKLWPIIKREYLERVRTRWFLIATIFAPLFFAFILIVPARLARHSSTTPSSLANTLVIDATTTGLGARVALNLSTPSLSTLPRVHTVHFDSISTAEHDATTALLEHRITGYLVLDSATLRGQHARYVGQRDNSPLDLQTLTHAVRDAVVATRLADRGLTGEQIDLLIPSSLTITTERVNTHDPNDPFKLLLAAFVAFFLYMSIVLFGQSMLSGVMEEKLTRVSEIVLSSVRPSTLLAGKVIGISAVGLTQQTIWLLGSALLLALRTPLFGPHPKDEAISALIDAALHVSPIWLAVVILFFLLGFTFFGSLYAAVGATVNSESEARQAAQPVMLILVMTVVLIQPVLSNPTGTLARVLSIVPFSAPILMPLRMSISSVPPTEVAASICILALSCVAAVWIAARIYRVALLMYGKRPTLRELGRWIREG